MQGSCPSDIYLKDKKKKKKNQSIIIIIIISSPVSYNWRNIVTSNIGHAL